MEPISRTKKKKAAEKLQKIGEELVRLDDAQLDELNLPPELRDAVSETRAIKSHGAYRRQLQYIGRLMRNCDSQIIQQELEKLAAGNDARNRRLKIVAHWRDELVRGNPDGLDRLLADHPDFDRPHLELLVNCARGASTRMNAKAAARRLFRYLVDHLH